MTIIPYAIRISGFKTYTSECPQTFVFPKGKGFYSIAGENRVEPQLGANDCGKTSLLDAVCFVLFDKTARGVKAANIINRDSKTAKVEFDFSDGDSFYSLTRTQAPKSLILSKDSHAPVDKTQAEVEELIGYGYEAFLRTVLMGQTNEFFFDLDPGDKLAIFSEILNLKIWEDKSNMAKGRASQAEADTFAIASEISNLAGQKESTEKNIEEQQDRIVKFEADRKIKITTLQQDRARHDSALTVANKKLAAAKKDVDAAYAAGESFVKEQEQKRKAERLLHDATSRVASFLQLLNNDLSNAEDALNIAKASGSKCSECGQELIGNPLQVYKEGLSKKKETITSLKEVAQKADKDLKAAQRAEDAAYEELTANKDKEAEFTSKHRSLSEAKQRLEKEAALLQQDIKNADRQLHSAEKDKNPFEIMVRQSKESLRDVKEKIVNKKSLLASKEKALAAMKFWIAAFKKIRLWIIEGALKEFEVETANALEPLGLGDWSVTFDVEKENKSGTVTKEFSVLVWPPDCEEPIAWRLLGGGVTQRLRVAGAAAFAGLISNRLGVYWPIEFWDEPTAHLSTDGVEGLLEYFASRAKNENKQVWLVDHRSHNSGLFDGVVKVVKEHDGSKLEFNGA